MTHNELTARYQQIIRSRKNLLNEEISYIITTLKNNDCWVGQMPESPATFLDPDNDSTAIKNVSLVDNDLVIIEFQGRKTPLRLLDRLDTAQVQAVAAFIDTNVRAMAERNSYDLVVVYSQTNSRKVNPTTLVGLNDEQVWDQLARLGHQDCHVFQLSGPKQKFPSFDQFVTEMNDHGFYSHYIVRLTLKEKYL